VPLPPQSVDKRCRRSHGWVERPAMDGPLVSRYPTLSRISHRFPPIFRIKYVVAGFSPRSGIAKEHSVSKLNAG